MDGLRGQSIGEVLVPGCVCTKPGASDGLVRPGLALRGHDLLWPGVESAKASAVTTVDSSHVNIHVINRGNNVPQKEGGFVEMKAWFLMLVVLLPLKHHTFFGRACIPHNVGS